MPNPRIRIVHVQYSYIYIVNFLRRSTETDEIKLAKLLPLDRIVSELDSISEPLRLTIMEHGTFIAEEIVRLTGISWDPEVTLVNVYPIAFFNSSSHPLFLRVGSIKNGRVRARSRGAVLGTLIHELIHNNVERLMMERLSGEVIITLFAIRILERIDPILVPQYKALLEKIGTHLAGC